MKPFPLALGALLCAAASPALAATFEIINADAPGEGLNDPTVVTPIGGNPGTTRGQQRLNVVQHVADYWAARLDSAVPIRIYVDFLDDACSPSSAVLVDGRPSRFLPLGSNSGQPRWFPVAYANARDGLDYTPANAVLEDSDVWLRIDSLIDAGCDGNAGWHYGYDAATSAPADKNPLLPAVMEGIARGVAFWVYNDLETGERYEHEGVEVSDALDWMLTDAREGEQGSAWADLDTGDRWDSAHSFDQLVWGGAHTTTAAANWLAPKAIGVVHGTLQRMEVNNGELGPRLPLLATIGGRVVYGRDSDFSFHDCTPLINAAELAGNIAIFDRGECTFATRALAGQAAGAIAVLVANNDLYGPSPMGGTDPALGIGLDDSIAFNDDNMTISLGHAADDLAGTTRGKVRMGAATYDTVARATDISSTATPHAIGTQTSSTFPH